jgi:signal transduction histidine kinase
VVGASLDDAAHLSGRHAADSPARVIEELRLLARKMADVEDTPELLGILCEAAAAQCDASGAAVFQTDEQHRDGADGAEVAEGDVVAATGTLLAARGLSFPLPGSMMRDVLRTRDAAMVDDFSNSAYPLTRVAPNLRLGPLLLAPLAAHNAIVGVLGVARDAGAAPFTNREADRLRTIADHAALAVWKSELFDRAQAAARAKSRFLATVSHELRTPLTALAGYEELLADQVLGTLSEPQHDVVERMRSVTQHLAGVIEELLAFSSLEEGKERVRPTEFLAADLMRSVAAVLEPMARQKHLELRCDVPSKPLRLNSDVDKIRQVLVNLGGNAVKFTDKGFVRISVESDTAEARFAVADSGPGISREDLALLFRPFTQLDTGLTRRHGGTGLGLYVSRTLATLLGARIEVQSTVGEGSVFTLVLPRALPGT